MDIKASRESSAEIQEALRLRAVRLLKTNRTQTEVADLLGVSRQAVNGWWKVYQSGGLKALKKKHRGRIKGEKRSIDNNQAKEIVKLISDHTPDQLKMSFALWTREAVRELISNKLGVTLGIRQVGNYLKEWGFTPQKPIKKAYEQNPLKVEKWLNEEYPEIQKKAKSENAEIFWADETAVRSDCQHQRGYAPKGKTPLLMKSGKRFGTNMISAVNNQGKVHFMVYDEKMDADMFIKFLKQLIKNRKRKLFLILDNLKVHHSHKVKEWVEEHSEKIELFFIPAYSPELNPDEYLNCDLKGNIHGKKTPRSKEDLIDNLDDFMFELRWNPERVKSYFEHPKINYAAA